MMMAIAFDRIGPATEVLYLSSIPIPVLKDGEVLIRVSTSSISPGDFLYIGGLYPPPKVPSLPRQIAGNHGEGVICATAPGVALELGSRVAFSYHSAWAEYVAIPSHWVMPIPATLPRELAGQFFNVITAWDLLSMAELRPGNWLAITAGGSHVAQMLTQFALGRGINVIAVIRQGHEQLQTPDGALILDLSENPEPTVTVHDMTRGNGIDVLVDHVGAETLSRLLPSISSRGRVIINGVLDSGPSTIYPLHLLTRRLSIKTHAYRYFFTPPETKHYPELSQIARLVTSDSFWRPTARFWSLEEFESAIRANSQRRGSAKDFFLPATTKTGE
jgi:NADPH:quinone reductase